MDQRDGQLDLNVSPGPLLALSIPATLSLHAPLSGGEVRTLQALLVIAVTALCMTTMREEIFGDVKSLLNKGH